MWREAVEAEVGLGRLVGGHADIAESSEMLVIRPELVRSGRAAEGWVGPIDEELLERMSKDGFRSVTPNGVLGDARGMSVAIGARCIEKTADVMAEAVRG